MNTIHIKSKRINRETFSIRTYTTYISGGPLMITDIIIAYTYYNCISLYKNIDVVYILLTLTRLIVSITL